MKICPRPNCHGNIYANKYEGEWVWECLLCQRRWPMDDKQSRLMVKANRISYEIPYMSNTGIECSAPKSRGFVTRMNNLDSMFHYGVR